MLSSDTRGIWCLFVRTCATSGAFISGGRSISSPIRAPVRDRYCRSQARAATVKCSTGRTCMVLAAVLLEGQLLCDAGEHQQRRLRCPVGRRGAIASVLAFSILFT
jgi:hypothetical protein